MSEIEKGKQRPLQRGKENIDSPMTTDEEQEWDTIVSKPHVRNALRRLAAEVLQQEAAGETEEGGFALE